jgi:hypothetical protein
MVRKQREQEQKSLLAALEIAEQAIRDGHTFDYSQELFEGAVQKGIEASKRGETTWSSDVRPQ